MRSLLEIRQHYTQVCAQIGDLEIRKQRLLDQIDVQLQPLYQQANQLELEGAQVKIVEDELVKLKLQEDQEEKEIIYKVTSPLI